MNAYCTGRLLLDVPIGHPAGAESWIGEGAKAAAGTTILVGEDFGFTGYVFDASGAIGKTMSESKGGLDGGLKKGTDFTSDCAPERATQSNSVRVLLTDATFYAKEDLSGEACKLEAGSKLENYSFSSSGNGVGKLTGDLIKQKCSLTNAYSKDAQIGTLFPK